MKVHLPHKRLRWAFSCRYNEVRPHRGIGRRTPKAAWEARDKARPSGPKLVVGAGVRVIMLIDGLDVRIVSEKGELLRHLTLDPTRDYQPRE